MLRVARLRPGNGSKSASREPRRTVDLAGYGVLAGGETFSLSVLDLSYDGCRIKTDLALLPGTKFNLSVLGLGRAAEAIVRWFKNGCAGLQFYPEDEAEAELTPRAFERNPLKAGVSLRRRGRKSYVANLFDLTPKGCRVEFIETPRNGEKVWAKLDGFDSIEATVRWVDGFKGGLEFTRPIYPAVFDLLLARLRQNLGDV